jgi:hypothetical protein
MLGHRFNSHVFDTLVFAFSRSVSLPQAANVNRSRKGISLKGAHPDRISTTVLKSLRFVIVLGIICIKLSFTPRIAINFPTFVEGSFLRHQTQILLSTDATLRGQPSTMAADAQIKLLIGLVPLQV